MTGSIIENVNTNDFIDCEARITNSPQAVGNIKKINVVRVTMAITKATKVFNMNKPKRVKTPLVSNISLTILLVTVYDIKLPIPEINKTINTKKIV